MTLIDEIYIAQRNAGEAACIANLERLGLIPKTDPIDPQSIITKLQAEAGMMREMLTQCASVVRFVTAKNDSEDTMLDKLHTEIVLVLRAIK